jgi:hypothetical protein
MAASLAMLTGRAWRRRHFRSPSLEMTRIFKPASLRGARSWVRVVAGRPSFGREQ